MARAQQSDWTPQRMCHSFVKFLSKFRYKVEGRQAGGPDRQKQERAPLLRRLHHKSHPLFLYVHRLPGHRFHHPGRVPLDKREGSVKGKLLLGGVFAPLRSPERLRTKTLEISR